MGLTVNRCRCGREIPHDPNRRKPHRFCSVCRAMFGANKQKGHRIRRKEGQNAD